MTSPARRVPCQIEVSGGVLFGAASRYMGTGREVPRTSQDFSPATWTMTTSWSSQWRANPAASCVVR